jgi:hypothetical protein
MTSVAKAYDTPVTPTMTVPSVEKLAAVISKNAAILNQQVIEKNLVPPTVNDISPPNFLELDDATSKELIQAARELQTIVQGPSQVLSILGFAVSPAMTVDPKCSAIRLTFRFQQHDISSLGVLLQFNIPSVVPLEGSISFRDLAEKTGVLEDKLSIHANSCLLRTSLTTRNFSSSGSPLCIHQFHLSGTSRRARQPYRPVSRPSKRPQICNLPPPCNGGSFPSGCDPRRVL